MEDYKEKYENALAKIKQIFDKGSKFVIRREVFESIFPELKESEDEKIRKALARFHKSTIDIDGIKGADILAWLEKQGESYTKNDVNDAYLKGISEAKNELEKQGEQKPVLDFKASNWYVSKVDGKIHDMTYNPVNKVEPKFKVGDFIVNAYCMGRVVEITNDAYLLDTEQGIPFSCPNTRLWDVTKDAKDGDILCTYECDEPKIVFILKGTPKKHYALSYHCYYNIMYPHFGSDSEKGCLAPNDEDVKPATKEQRDLLFTKMKEAGYEWDAEKKELKKIHVIDDGKAEMDYCFTKMMAGEKVSPAWSEEDKNFMYDTLSNLTELKDRYGEVYGNVGKCIDWLKSIKDRVQPQPKQEWSEKDEEMCQETIDWFEKKCFPYALEEENPARESIKWLKSLKNRL